MKLVGVDLRGNQYYEQIMALEGGLFVDAQCIRTTPILKYHMRKLQS